ncbi:hypothetical protein ACL02U_09660 [Streptomyces sp. MS06]|uniref:hypothetical protein n=1 Tax=Streptomyces sp. MS06 TaxID=3385974 RepID=UPI00399FCA8C
MSRLARPATRLAAGSRTLAHRLGARTAAWIARGRRTDLTGWRAALGCWTRLGLVLLGLYALWRIVRAVPQLMWLLTACWTFAAWRAGRPTPAEPAAEEPAAQPDGTAIRALLLDLMGDRSGVHLRTVLAHLQAQGQWEGRTVTDMRTRLEQLGVPVHRGVKVAGVPTWGVRRRDLHAPSPTAAEEASTGPSTAA